MDEQIDVREVLAHMSPGARVEWDLAVERWQNARLRARVAELENAGAPTTPPEPTP